MLLLLLLKKKKPTLRPGLRGFKPIEEETPPPQQLMVRPVLCVPYTTVFVFYSRLSLAMP